MADVEELIARVAGRRGLGGVGVAVVRSGVPTEFTCSGLADAPSGRSIGPDTVFRIASITKTMTAIGLLQLRDRGLFALDDPVNAFLQGLRVVPPAGAPAVTFRHLLTHTAGIGEVPSVASLVRAAAWGAGKRGAPPVDLAELYGAAMHTEVPAGSKWAYANHGFVLLGKLVEDISGQALPDYMRAQLFAPLGMDHTDYRRSERVNGALATGSHWLLGRFRPVRDYDLNVLGAGAVFASLNDMATYTSWLLGGGSVDVLDPSTLSEMTTTQHTIGPGFPGTGLAFSLSRCGPHDVFGHDGNMPGFASVMSVVPAEGVGIVVLTNTATVLGANQLAVALLRNQLAVPDPVESLPSAGVTDSPQAWSALSGYYAPAPGFLTNLRHWQVLGGEVHVVVRRRTLMIKALSPVRALRRGLVLHRSDPDDPSRYAFVYEGMAIPVEFERQGAGPAVRLRIGRPVNTIVHRRSSARSSGLRVRGVALIAMALLQGRRMRRRSSRVGA